jgi:hypothetical protein
MGFARTCLQDPVKVTETKEGHNSNFQDSSVVKKKPKKPKTKHTLVFLVLPQIPAKFWGGKCCWGSFKSR